jgi:putative hydrolase of the HAD superfamily
VPLRAVLLDLDDTLVHEQESVTRAFLATCRPVRERYGIDPDALQRSVRRYARELWYASPVYDWCKRIGMSSWEGLSSRFEGTDEHLAFLRGWAPEFRRQAWTKGLAEHGIVDADLVEQLAAAYPRERGKNHVAFPDAELVVRRLKEEYRLGLVTNGVSDIQLEKLAAVRLTVYFDAIMVSGDLGIGKPEAAIFLAALGKLEARASEAVMVGDSLERDMQGGRAVGLKTVWMNPAHADPGGIRPDAVITNLNELPGVLRGLA